MKRLLVVGASILQVPAIIEAKKMGLHVGVLDYNSEAIGVSYADSFFCVSTNDQHGVLEAARVFRADGIVTLATDMPMRSIAYACSEMGLKGLTYHTAVKATDKAEMIHVFETNNVAHPWYFVLDDPKEVEGLIERIKYPCICKPTDSSGSRGIVLVNDESELQNAIMFSSKSGRSGSVIIEELLVGHEVSVEMILYQGNPHVIAITDKLTTGAPHFVEMGHSQPSQLPDEDQFQIKNLARKATLALGITDGAAHVEIMMTEGGPKIIELGARLGGDFITTHLVPLSTGVNMVRAIIRIALGEPPDIDSKWSRGSAIRYLQTQPGRIIELTGLDAARSFIGIDEVFVNSKPGDMILDIKSSSDRLGYVIAHADTAEEAISICDRAIKQINVTVCTQH